MEQPIFKTFRFVMMVIVIGFIGLFTLQSVVNEKVMVVNSPQAEKGQLNLNQWDETRYIRTLNGDWRFYWDSLLANEQLPEVYAVVPDTWDKYDFIGNPSKGTATYSLNITGLKPNHIYALKSLDQVTAFRLSAQGKVIGTNGIVGIDDQSTKPQWKPIRTEFVSNEQGHANLVMTISNFDYNRGGFWNNLLIGEPQRIHEYAMSRILGEMFLFSGLFIMAAFFLGMHFLYPKEKDTLAFALFCLMTSMQIGLTGERVLYYFVNKLSWYSLVRIEYWSGYMLLPLFGFYILSRFHKDTHQWLNIVFAVLGVVLTLVCFVIPIEDLAVTLPYYKYLCLMSAPYFLVVMIKVIVNGRTGAIWMLLAFLTMFVSVIKDTFYMSEYSALPYGSFVFLIAFALLTITKYVGVQKTNVILESRVMRDPLTGVYNRSYLDAFQEFGINSPYFVIFLDLDRFKQVNDVFGHDVGDRVLLEIAKRLRRLCRPADVLCRYGGDEFVMLVMDDGFIEIDSFLKLIRETIHQEIVIDGNEASVGVSIGLSHYPTEGYTLSDLIRQSDLAMYKDKLSDM